MLKLRTRAVASTFVHYVGGLLGVAVMIVAVCEGIAAVVLCVQSEMEE
jgi:hypothetical protein